MSDSDNSDEEFSFSDMMDAQSAQSEKESAQSEEKPCEKSEFKSYTDRLIEHICSNIEDDDNIKLTQVIKQIRYY